MNATLPSRRPIYIASLNCAFDRSNYVQNLRCDSTAAPAGMISPRRGDVATPASRMRPGHRGPSPSFDDDATHLGSPMLVVGFRRLVQISVGSHGRRCSPQNVDAGVNG